MQGRRPTAVLSSGPWIFSKSSRDSGLSEMKGDLLHAPESLRNSCHGNEGCFYVSGNGFLNSRASPNLIGSPSATGSGKVLPTKSPPPPGGGSLGMSSRKPDLRVVIPPSSKGMMPPLVRPLFFHLFPEHVHFLGRETGRWGGLGPVPGSFPGTSHGPERSGRSHP